MGNLWRDIFNADTRELYLAVQTGGATRLGGALDPAYSSGTTLIFNTDCGITYYF